MNEVTVEEVMSGAESSLRLKRLAKQAAWENGSAPDETVHTVYQGDAREMLGKPWPSPSGCYFAPVLQPHGSSVGACSHAAV